MLALRREPRLAFCQWRGILHDRRSGARAVWTIQIRLRLRVARLCQNCGLVPVDRVSELPAGRLPWLNAVSYQWA